jgi:hypothetical protein
VAGRGGRQPPKNRNFLSRLPIYEPGGGSVYSALAPVPGRTGDVSRGRCGAATCRPGRRRAERRQLRDTWARPRSPSQGPGTTGEGEPAAVGVADGSPAPRGVRYRCDGSRPRARWTRIRVITAAP